MGPAVALAIAVGGAWLLSAGVPGIIVAVYAAAPKAATVLESVTSDFTGGPLGASPVPRVAAAIREAEGLAARAGPKLLAAGGDKNAAGVIRSFVTTEERIFFRVFTDRPQGGFLTAVPPRSRAFAQEALALPKDNTARFIQEVRVPAGVRLQRSRAAALNGRRGGAEQFEILPGQRDAEIIFGPGVPFP
ncbi:MAG: hypothetical protein Q8R92_16520 [Deltaproteobacteria bacterium]|nr:hypothetical protein [Deltaproteobacteria bacterium]